VLAPELEDTSIAGSIGPDGELGDLSTCRVDNGSGMGLLVGIDSNDEVDLAGQ
jgi:hypothetical protein